MPRHRDMPRRRSRSRAAAWPAAGERTLSRSPVGATQHPGRRSRRGHGHPRGAQPVGAAGGSRCGRPRPRPASRASSARAATPTSPTSTRSGVRVGEPGWIRAGELANVHEPELRRYDRFGHRIDTVEYHPAYHDLMTRAVADGLAGAPWADDRAGAHVGRAAELRHVDPGGRRPRLPDLDDLLDRPRAPGRARRWRRRGSRCSRRPPTTRPRCRASGQGRRHRRHGHDREAGRLRRAGQHHHGHATTRPPGPGEEYALTGHKWFCSAPMSDLFLMLANTDAGLSCFAVPRWLPDGTRNAHRHRTAEGQAGQPVERVERDRDGRRPRPPRRRGGPRHRHDPDDGQPHPARLRHRRHRADAGRAQPGDPPRPAPRARSASGSSTSRSCSNVLADLAVESEAATSR